MVLWHDAAREFEADLSDLALGGVIYPVWIRWAP